MKPHWPLVVIVAAYLIIGALYAIRIPAWQMPDEPAHYNYVRQLAQTGAIPVIESTDWVNGLVPIGPTNRDVPVEKLTYEDHQPPLFYLLSAPIFALTNGSLTALRLFSLLVGALTIVFAYFAVVTVFPTHPWLAAFAAAFVALLPQHMFIMAGFNNDSLAEALLALALWLSVRLILQREAARSRDIVILAVVVGLCLLTKAQAYLALPIALIAVFLAMREPGKPASRWLRPLLIVLIVSGLFGLLWWIHSAQLYGGADFLGLQRHNAVVIGQPTTAEWIAQYGAGGVLARMAQTTFQSYWGQFGWMSIVLPAWMYLLFLGFTLVSAALFVAWWLHGVSAKRRLQGQTQTKSGASIYSPYLVLTKEQSQSLTLMALLALFTLLAFFWYNTQFVQHQGRYLYPALVPVGTAFALGWGFIFSRRVRIERWLWLILLIVLSAIDLYFLFRVILRAMEV
jgi:uncharacterized membrane protein